MSELLTKYLSDEDLKIIHDLQNAVKINSITVTCMGLYNHGKSTLLNTLIRDFEHTTFKTADVRETSANKSVKYNNVIFVDTPGLNHNELDDKKVMDAVKESDINLFVHTITAGEFDANEIQFLQYIKKHWGNSQEFIDRTIFVLSQIDNVNSEDDIKKAETKMLSQIADIFNSKATIISVSAKRFSQGVLEDKKKLVEKSNIEELEKMIDSMSNTFLESITQTKKSRLENHFNYLINKLDKNVQENKLAINKFEKEQQKNQKLLSQDIQKVEATLKNMYAKLGDE